MGISAKVIADSITPKGVRLTTMVWRYPRFIHSEVMTHRVLSRNAASSRAIPVAKMIEQVKNDPAMPVFWGINRPGMQAKEELSDDSNGKFMSDRDVAKLDWLIARDQAVESVERLMKIGLHKQIANRILEPWMWMTTIVSATEWANLYHLRRHPDAQPEFKALADAAYAAHMASKPEQLEVGQWHIPFMTENDSSFSTEDRLKMSVARCARVSYLNHDGTNPDPSKDFALHDMLMKAPHASPFEHQAKATDFTSTFYGNFRGWEQYRKTLPNENTTTYEGL